MSLVNFKLIFSERSYFKASLSALVRISLITLIVSILLIVSKGLIARIAKVSFLCSNISVAVAKALACSPAFV